jgi:hypothetical protein
VIAALRDPASWRERAEAGRQALEQHRGTAARSAKLITGARDRSRRER